MYRSALTVTGRPSAHPRTNMFR